MTIPEWVAIITISGIGCVLWSVLWYWMKHVMGSQKEQTQTLGEVRDHLALMNGRLGKSEQWSMTHDLYDANAFKEIKDNQKEMKHDIKERVEQIHEDMKSNMEELKDDMRVHIEKHK